jgi:acyl-coenzyme A thioesterase PaaI-like protein
MLEFTVENLSTEEIDRLRAIYEPLARSVRELVDATIRTEVGADAVAAAKAEIDAATARLRDKQIDGPFGVRYNAEGESMAWGNPVIGARNPIAPPLVIRPDPSDPEKARVFSEFDLGAAYEGPPGHVHGGVCALVLDHVLGEIASDPGNGRPALTGSINFRYLRATPLGRLRAEAWLDRIDGVKIYAVGHLADAQGITVEAEGVFIIPKWAR